MLKGIGLTTSMALLAVLAANTASVTSAWARSGYGAVGTYVSCDFPDGWNSTEASHQLEGTPDGDHHQCLVSGRPTPLIASVVANPHWRGYVGLWSNNETR
jgi:hypothetical protein